MSPDVREGQVWQTATGVRLRITRVGPWRVTGRYIDTAPWSPSGISYRSRSMKGLRLVDGVTHSPSYSPEDVKRLVEAARRFSAMAGVRRAHSLACKCNGVDFDGLSCGQRHSALARALEPFGDLTGKDG